MGQVCKICTHPKRLEIDREIVQGQALARIAKEYGVPINSLYTHSKEHITRQLSQAWDRKELEQSFDLLNRIDTIIIRAEDIFKRNYQKGADVTALKALDSQRNTIELLAKISYSLHQSKLAEIELMKQQSGEADREYDEARQAEISKALEILTDNEREMLFQIQMKVIEKKRDWIIIPDTDDFPLYTHQQHIDTVDDTIM